MLFSNIFRSLDDDFYPIALPSFSNRQRRPHLWTASVPLGGFEPSDVNIKEDKNDKGEIKIIVHARREEGEDLNEIKKGVKVPSNVDHEQLKTIFTKDGLLILKAPFKETRHEIVEPHRINREDTWNGVWGEMERLNQHMHNMVDVSGALKFPRTEFVANEGGDGGIWRMHVNIGKDFKPDEVKLHNVNNCVKLEAKKEIKSDHGVSSRYLSEMVSIPDGVDQEHLKSRLFDNGDLVLEAPCAKVPALLDNKSAKAIPIDVAKTGNAETMAVDN